MIGNAPDLDSWFMTRLHLEEEFLPPGGGPHTPERPGHLGWPRYPIDEALRQAAGLVERFQRAKADPGADLGACRAGGRGGRPDRRGRGAEPDERTRRSARDRAERCLPGIAGRLPFDGPRPQPPGATPRCAREDPRCRAADRRCPGDGRTGRDIGPTRRRPRPPRPRGTLPRHQPAGSRPSRSIAAHWRSPSERIAPGI